VAPTLRTSIHIPAIPLDGSAGGGLLELIVETGCTGGTMREALARLRGQGFGDAIDRTLAWLETRPELRRRVAGKPVDLWLVNPMTELSNSAGASLGIALALVGAAEHWSLAGVVASGRLDPETGRLMSDHRLPQRLHRLGTWLARDSRLPVLIAAPDGWKRDDAGIAAELEAQGVSIVFADHIDEAIGHCRRLAGLEGVS
jgi:hypothetical protein